MGNIHSFAEKAGCEQSSDALWLKLQFSELFNSNLQSLDATLPVFPGTGVGDALKVDKLNQFQERLLLQYKALQSPIAYFDNYLDVSKNQNKVQPPIAPLLNKRDLAIGLEDFSELFTSNENINEDSSLRRLRELVQTFQKGPVAVTQRLTRMKAIYRLYLAISRSDDKKNKPRTKASESQVWNIVNRTNPHATLSEADPMQILLSSSILIGVSTIKSLMDCRSSECVHAIPNIITLLGNMFSNLLKPDNSSEKSTIAAEAKQIITNFSKSVSQASLSSPYNKVESSSSRPQLAACEITDASFSICIFVAKAPTDLSQISMGILPKNSSKSVTMIGTTPGSFGISPATNSSSNFNIGVLNTGSVLFFCGNLNEGWMEVTYNHSVNRYKFTFEPMAFNETIFGMTIINGFSARILQFSSSALKLFVTKPVSNRQIKCDVKCRNGHKFNAAYMKELPNDYRKKYGDKASVSCDACKTIVNNDYFPYFHCQSCSYDLCARCYVDVFPQTAIRLNDEPNTSNSRHSKQSALASLQMNNCLFHSLEELVNFLRDCVEFSSEYDKLTQALTSSSSVSEPSTMNRFRRAMSQTQSQESRSNCIDLRDESLSLLLLIAVIRNSLSGILEVVDILLNESKPLKSRMLQHCISTLLDEPQLVSKFFDSNSIVQASLIICGISNSRDNAPNLYPIVDILELEYLWKLVKAGLVEYENDSGSLNSIVKSIGGFALKIIYQNISCAIVSLSKRKKASFLKFTLPCLLIDGPKDVIFMNDLLDSMFKVIKYQMIDPKIDLLGEYAVKFCSLRDLLMPSPAKQFATICSLIQSRESNTASMCEAELLANLMQDLDGNKLMELLRPDNVDETDVTDEMEFILVLVSLLEKRLLSIIVTIENSEISDGSGEISELFGNILRITETIVVQYFGFKITEIVQKSDESAIKLIESLLNRLIQSCVLCLDAVLVSMNKPIPNSPKSTFAKIDSSISQSHIGYLLTMCCYCFNLFNKDVLSPSLSSYELCFTVFNEIVKKLRDLKIRLAEYRHMEMLYCEVDCNNKVVDNSSNTPQHQTVTVWKASDSNTSLEFSSGDTVCRRPGSTSCFPAATAAISEDISVFNVVLTEGSSNTNWLTVGLSKVGFQLSNSDGFGRTSRSWGIADDRSKSDCSIFAYNSSRVCECPRKLKTGDVITVIAHISAGCVEITVNNGEFTHIFGSPPPQPFYKILAAKNNVSVVAKPTQSADGPSGSPSGFCFGATFANDHVLTIKPVSLQTSSLETDSKQNRSWSEKLYTEIIEMESLWYNLRFKEVKQTLLSTTSSSSQGSEELSSKEALYSWIRNPIFSGGKMYSSDERPHLLEQLTSAPNGLDEGGVLVRVMKKHVIKDRGSESSSNHLVHAVCGALIWHLGLLNEAEILVSYDESAPSDKMLAAWNIAQSLRFEETTKAPPSPQSDDKGLMPIPVFKINSLPLNEEFNNLDDMTLSCIRRARLLLEFTPIMEQKFNDSAMNPKTENSKRWSDIIIDFIKNGPEPDMIRDEISTRNKKLQHFMEFLDDIHFNITTYSSLDNLTSTLTQLQTNKHFLQGYEGCDSSLQMSVTAKWFNIISIGLEKFKSILCCRLDANIDNMNGSFPIAYSKKFFMNSVMNLLLLKYSECDINELIRIDITSFLDCCCKSTIELVRRFSIQFTENLLMSFKFSKSSSLALQMRLLNLLMNQVTSIHNLVPRLEANPTEYCVSYSGVIECNPLEYGVTIPLSKLGNNAHSLSMSMWIWVDKISQSGIVFSLGYPDFSSGKSLGAISYFALKLRESGTLVWEISDGEQQISASDTLKFFELSSGIVVPTRKWFNIILVLDSKEGDASMILDGFVIAKKGMKKTMVAKMKDGDFAPSFVCFGQRKSPLAFAKGIASLDFSSAICLVANPYITGKAISSKDIVETYSSTCKNFLEPNIMFETAKRNFRVRNAQSSAKTFLLHNPLGKKISYSAQINANLSSVDSKFSFGLVTDNHHYPVDWFKYLGQSSGGHISFGFTPTTAGFFQKNGILYFIGFSGEEKLVGPYSNKAILRITFNIVTNEAIFSVENASENVVFNTPMQFTGSANNLCIRCGITLDTQDECEILSSNTQAESDTLAVSPSITSSSALNVVNTGIIISSWAENRIEENCRLTVANGGSSIFNNYGKNKSKALECSAIIPLLSARSSLTVMVTRCVKLGDTFAFGIIRHKDNESMNYCSMDFTNNFGRQQNTWGMFDERKDSSQNCSLNSSSEPEVSPTSHQCLEEGDLVNITVDYTKSPALLYFTINGDLVRTMKVPIFSANAYEDYAFYLLVPLQHEFTIVPDGGLLRTFEPPGEFIANVISQVTEVTTSSLEIATNDIKYLTVDMGLLFNYKRCESFISSTSNLYNTVGVLVRVLGQKYMSLLPQDDKFVETCAQIWDIAFTCSLRSLRFAASNLLFEFIKFMELKQLLKLFESKMSCRANMESLLTSLITNLGSQLNDISISTESIENFGDSLGYQLRGLVRAMCQRKDSNTEVIPVLLTLAYVATDSVGRLIELQKCIVGNIMKNKGHTVNSPTKEVLNSSSFAIGYLSLFSDVLDVNAIPGKIVYHKSFNSSIADRHILICDSYSRTSMGAEEKYAVLIPCDLEEKQLEFEFATDKPLNPERKYPEFVPLSVIKKNASAKLDQLMDYCMLFECTGVMNLLNVCLECDTADIRPIQAQKKKNTALKCLTFESSHPYLDNSEIFFKISIPRAKEMVISFDSRSRTENNYDYIKFYKDSGRNSTWGSEKYTGQTFPGVSSTPPLVIGTDTVYFYFHSDGSNNDWGYKFTVAADQQVLDEDHIQEAYTELFALRTLKFLATKTTSFFLKLHQESQSTKPGIITGKEPKAIDSFIVNNWNGILRTLSVEKTLLSYFKFYNQLNQKPEGEMDALEGVDFSKIPSDNEFELTEILDCSHQFGCIEASENTHLPDTITSGPHASEIIYNKILESFYQIESKTVDLSEVAETSPGSISKSLLAHLKNPNGVKKYSPSNYASYAASQSAQPRVSSETINLRLICTQGTTHCRIRASPSLKSPEIGNVANGTIVAVTGAVNDFWRLADGQGFCIVKIDGVDWVLDVDEQDGWTGLIQSPQFTTLAWKQKLRSIFMSKLSTALVSSSYDLLSHMFTCWPNNRSFEASSSQIELLLRASGAHSDYVKGEQHFKIASQIKGSDAKTLDLSSPLTSFRAALETLLLKSRRSDNPAQFNNTLISVSKKVFGYIISKIKVQNECESNEPVLEPVVMESAHHYENDTRLMQQLSIPGATGLEIIFDERSSTEKTYDYVCFYGDSSKRQLLGVKYSGRRGSENNWPGVRDNSSLIINSDTCWVYFETDNSNTDWGWKLTAYPITSTASNAVSVIRDLEFGETLFTLIDNSQQICLHLSPSTPTIGFGLEIYKLLLSSFENSFDFFDNEEVIYLLNLLSASIDILPSIDPFSAKKFLEIISKTFIVYIQLSKSPSWSRLARDKCERISTCILKMGSKIIDITSRILNNLAPIANDAKSSPSAFLTSFVEVAIFAVAYGLTKSQKSPIFKVEPSQYFVDPEMSLSFQGKGITCTGTSCTNYAFGQHFEHLVFPLTHMTTTHTVSRYMKVPTIDPNGKFCVGLSLIPMSSSEHLISEFTSAKAMILLSPIRIMLASQSSSSSEGHQILISEGDIIGFNVSNNDNFEWNVSISRNGIPCTAFEGVSSAESPFGSEFRGIPGFKYYVLVPFVAIECNLSTEVIFLDEVETPAFVTKNPNSSTCPPIKSSTLDNESLLLGSNMNELIVGSGGNSDEDDDGVFDGEDGDDEDDEDDDNVDDDENDNDNDDDDENESDSESTEQVEIVAGKVQNVTSFDIQGEISLEVLEEGKIRNPFSLRSSSAVRLERDCEIFRVRVKILQAEELQDRFSFGIAEESNFSLKNSRFGRSSRSWGLCLCESGPSYRIYNRNTRGHKVGPVAVGDILSLDLNNRTGIAEFKVNNNVTHSICISNRSKPLIVGISYCPDMTIQVLQDTAAVPPPVSTNTVPKLNAMITIGQDKLHLPQYMNIRIESMSENVSISSRCNMLTQLLYDNFIGRYTFSKQSGELHSTLTALNRTYQLLSHQNNDISCIPLSSLMEPTYIEDLLPNVMQECTQIHCVSSSERRIQVDLNIPGAISYAVKVLGSTIRREGSVRVPIGLRINMTCSGRTTSSLKYSTYLACDSQGTVGDILCPQFMEWVLKDVKLQIGKAQINNSSLLEAQYHSFILKAEDDAHYQVSDSVVRLISRDDGRSRQGDIGTVVASNEVELVVVWNNGFQESISHASFDIIGALWLRRPVKEDSAIRRSVDLVTTPFFSNNVSFTFEPIFEIGSEQQENCEWNIPIAIIPIISPEYIMESPLVEDRRIAMLDDHLLAINGCVFTEEIRNRSDLCRSDLRTIECRYAKKRLRQIDAAMVSFIDAQLSQHGSEITSLNANWSNAAPTTMQGLAKFPMLMSLINDEIHRIMRTATLSSGVVTVNPADNKILKNRYAFVHQLNFYFKSAMMYINLENSITSESSRRDKLDIFSLSSQISNSRALFCSVVKMPTIKAMISGSEVTGSKFEVVISRSRALRHKQAGDIDNEGQWSVFGQLFRIVHGKPPSTIRRANQLWDTLLAGERAQDAGGPYRESLSAICDDLQSSYLPLFKLSPNTHADSSLGLTGEYVINPDVQKSSTQMEMLCFVGKLMGTAIRSGNFLDICLAPLVWKLIVGDEVSLDDIATIDNTAYQMIQKYRQWKISGSSTLPEHLSFLTFTWSSLSGATVDLIPNGSHITLDVENIDSFCKLLEDFRLNEMRVVCGAIRAGIEAVVPSAVLSLSSHSQLEEMVCGKSKISISLLKSVADYSGCKADDSHIAWFWEVLENNFSNDDLRAFVRFAWGRSRLPLNAASFSHKFKIQNLSKSNPDLYLPESHTCFFTVDIPKYSSKEILLEKLLYAIYNCAAIDGDSSSARSASLEWET